MTTDEPAYERPREDCVHFLPGTPAALPMPNGWICGGIWGQPCPGCVRMARGVRGQAEFFAATMGHEPGGKP